MKSHLVILLNLLFCFSLSAQTEKKICVAFYNQENLFDTIDDPKKIDEEFTPTGTYQWNSERYQNKLANMSKVIAAMNDGKGPDFLGMCEVENDRVLIDLCSELKKKNLDYGYVWHESRDVRGIDNALLYKKSLVKRGNSHLYMIDSAGIGNDQTRGILMGDFLLKNNGHLILMVNHWPSRREGEEQSAYKRIFVATTLKAITDSIQKKNDDCAIILMGDFNDYPNNVSLTQFLHAKKDMKDVDDNDFYNPMYALMEAGLGSYKHKGEWNFLDQFLLNEELLEAGEKISYVPNSAAVFKQEWMLETEEKYKGNPKRTFGGKKYLNGFSDHLPVYLYLQLK